MNRRKILFVCVKERKKVRLYLFLVSLESAIKLKGWKMIEGDAGLAILSERERGKGHQNKREKRIRRSLMWQTRRIAIADVNCSAAAWCCFWRIPFTFSVATVLTKNKVSSGSQLLSTSALAACCLLPASVACGALP